jgi:hypothetical protein
VRQLSIIRREKCGDIIMCNDNNNCEKRNGRVRAKSWRPVSLFIRTSPRSARACTDSAKSPSFLFRRRRILKKLTANLRKQLSTRSKYHFYPGGTRRDDTLISQLFLFNLASTALEWPAKLPRRRRICIYKLLPARNRGFPLQVGAEIISQFARRIEDKTGKVVFYFLNLIILHLVCTVLWKEKVFLSISF